MKPIVAIGDVHGDIYSLRQMLAYVRTLNRTAIFVGDYVNGGMHSREVIEELSSLKRADPSRWILLAGNHDLALLDYLNGGDFKTVARMGGVQTIASYVDGFQTNVRKAFTSAFPAHHKSFLQDLSPCYEENDILISHSGFSPACPNDRSLETMAKSSDTRIFSSATLQKLVVCGHYRQWDQKPFVSQNLICVDTGCGVSKGPLTAVLLPERKFVSSENL